MEGYNYSICGHVEQRVNTYLEPANNGYLSFIRLARPAVTNTT